MNGGHHGSLKHFQNEPIQRVFRAVHPQEYAKTWGDHVPFGDGLLWLADFSFAHGSGLSPDLTVQVSFQPLPECHT